MQRIHHTALALPLLLLAAQACDDPPTPAQLHETPTPPPPPRPHEPPFPPAPPVPPSSVAPAATAKKPHTVHHPRPAEPHHASPASSTHAHPAVGAAPRPVHTPTTTCCRHCHKGKACGNSCIAADEHCDAPPGCACDG